jgi:drug/metabolite transporter (DMT)-like permease
MGLGFAALGLLPLPEVTAIGYAAPVMVVILAAVFLKESIGIFRIGAVTLGLVGVLVVISPRLGVVHSDDAGLTEAIGVALVLASAFCAAIAQVTVRTMVRTETTASIVFYFSVTATVLASLTAPFGWVWPSPQTIAMLISAGLLGGIGQILLTSSYRFADVSVIAPFEYASILFAVLSGYFFFAEVPTIQTLIGSALVICAGIAIILREHQLGLRRGRARPVMTPGDK